MRISHAFLWALAVSSIAHADPIQGVYVEEDPRFEAELYLVSDFSVDRQNGKTRDQLKIANSTLAFSARLTEYVRAQVTLNLEKQLRVDGRWADVEFDVGSFVDEAFIEIRFEEGRAWAIIIGKQAMAFGGNFSHMPAYYNNPFFDLLKQDQVFGLTVELGQRFGLDLIEFSVFETEGDDLSIGTIDGASLRVRKNLGERFQVIGSAMYKGNADTDGTHEHRATIGLVYLGESGLRVWGEGIYLKNEPTFDSTAGLTAGVSVPTGHGRVVAEANFLANAFTQFAVGYGVEISKNVLVGVEARYTVSQDGAAIAEGFSLGGNVELLIGPETTNEKPIFSGAERR